MSHPGPDRAPPGRSVPEFDGDDLPDPYDDEFVGEDDVREDLDAAEAFGADDPVTGVIGSGAEPKVRETRRELTDRDREMLAFERQWWRHPGSKEQAIKERFGLSPTHYFQQLNALLDLPAALAFDPLVVGRLRRLRETRTRGRG